MMDELESSDAIDDAEEREECSENSNSDQLATKINILGSARCLFWASALAYLTAVKYNRKVFRERFEKLFGDTHSRELSTDIQNLIKDPSSDSVSIHGDPVLGRLVTEIFRNRVIDQMSSDRSGFVELITINDILNSNNKGYVTNGAFLEEFRREFSTEITQYNIDVSKLKPDDLNEDTIQDIDNEFDKVPDQEKIKQFKFQSYLQCMRNSEAWGGDCEIRAISQVLRCNIRVLLVGREYLVGYAESSDEIYLSNNGGVHYEFGLINIRFLIDAIRKPHMKQIAKTYFNLGIDNINYQDSNGWTALHFAAQSGNMEIIHMLLARGALTKIENNINKIPIQTAVFHASGIEELNDHMEIAVALLDKELPEYNLTGDEMKILVYYIDRHHPTIFKNNRSLRPLFLLQKYPPYVNRELNYSIRDRADSFKSESSVNGSITK